MEVLVLVIAAYMLPGIVALARKHPNAASIIALDLLLGWTLLGWVAAFVWSLTAIPQEAMAAGNIALPPRAAPVSSHAGEIAELKRLLDSGTITQAEFEQMKARIINGR